jgi:hypothetical protein
LPSTGLARCDCPGCQRGRTETRTMDKTKRVRTAETPKQPWPKVARAVSLSRPCLGVATGLETPMYVVESCDSRPDQVRHPALTPSPTACRVQARSGGHAVAIVWRPSRIGVGTDELSYGPGDLEISADFRGTAKAIAITLQPRPVMSISRIELEGHVTLVRTAGIGAS